MSTRLRAVGTLLALGIALAFTACSDDDSSGDPAATVPSSGTPTTAANLVPEPTPTPTSAPDAVYWAVDEGADNWPDRERLRVWLFVPRSLLGEVTLLGPDGSPAGLAQVMGSGYFSGAHCVPRVPEDNPSLIVVGPLQLDPVSQAAFLAAPTTYRAEVDQRELNIPNPKHVQLPLVDSGCRTESATPSPTNLSGYGHPPDTSTGDPTLDGLVATLLGPAEEVEQRLVATPTPCILEPKGTGELPKCPEGAPEGTIMNVFRATDCDAAESESVLRAIRSVAAQPRSLFAVYKSQTEAGSWVPSGDFTILVVLESDSRAPGAGIQFRVAGSGIVGIKFGCGKLARDLVRDIPRSDFLVSPK